MPHLFLQPFALLIHVLFYVLVFPLLNFPLIWRNVSSERSEARRKLRECTGLVDSLMYIVQSQIDRKDVDNKVTITLIYLTLKGNSIKVCLQALWKKLYKAFCGSGWSCEKSDKLPQVMSLESALVGAENDKFENKKIWGCGVRKKWAFQTSVACFSSLLEASSSRPH